jgi:photosystem II stability/assembly factor-like uncharacterized protein
VRTAERSPEIGLRVPGGAFQELCMRSLRSPIVPIILFLAAAGGGSLALRAQSPTALDPSLLSALTSRSIGPANTGGRVDDFAVARVPGAPDTIYVGTASGGIFRSTNQGTSWTPVFDGVDAMMSIGDLAVAPSNPNVVWAGTGEANNRQSSSWGDGVYKSVNGGRTWARAGLEETRHVGRIVIHPRNPDIVYVAAVGHLWGSNAERGVFKTSDAGRTWQKVLFVDDNTGATDIVMDPQDPETLFAAMYQRQRKAWGFNGGGPGSNIYRTTDGGATWTKLTAGLPKGDKGRIGLDLFHGDGRIVYAVVEAAGHDSGVYRSSDRGDNWTQLGSLNPRPMYYSQIRVDPKDKSRVYLLGSNRGFYISDDGGRDFKEVFSTVHSEDHALWIDPDDTNHLLVGGDGGVSISWDRGATWEFRDNLPIGQFYEISADMADPFTVCGGLQDNGHWCVPSATRNRTGISNHDAFNIGSGDGFYARIDPTDPHTVVIESQEGRANRVDLRTLERQAIAPVTQRPTRTGLRTPRGAPSPDADRERWNWNTPIAMSSFDPKVLYMGSNMLFRSADRGVTWTAISGDLTAHVDRDTLEMMGARVPPGALSRHDGLTSYSTLTTIAESPLDAKLLYTGSDDGRVHVTRDGGKAWTDITARVSGLPANAYVSSLLASRHMASRVYATFDNHYNDDYRPLVFVSDDFGQTWKSIAGNLPAASVHRLREDFKNPRLLFVGHERGLDVSIDGGASWTPFTANLPHVPVDDLLIHPRDNALVLGTHGRGIWILDDIAPLQALTPDAIKSDGFLVAPSRARLLSLYNPQAWYGAGQYFAPNPDFGAALTYYLRDAGSGDAEITVRDTGGALVRTLTGAARRGLNRVSWDLRMDPPLAAGERESPAGAGGFGGSPTGPAVLPGTYAVSIKAGGRTLTGTVAVEGDPRIAFSDADRGARQSALLDLYDVQKSLAIARKASRTLAAQTETMKKEVAKPVTVLDALADHLAQIQADLTARANTASGLSRSIEGYSGLPTADQKRQIDWVFEDATSGVAALNHVIDTEAPAVYADLMKHGTWPARPDAIAAPVKRGAR